MLAGTLPRLASLLAQPTVIAAGVATGVLAGTVAVASGAIPVTDPGPRQVALYECPPSGRVVTSIAPDQKVLVTARSADGAWLQIYVGEAGIDRGWARATALSLRSAPDSLPVADCTPTATAEPSLPPETLGPPSSGPSLSGPTAAPSVAATAAPSSAPVTAAPSATAVATKTPKPTASPTPTPVPLTGPVLSNLKVYNGEDAGGGLWRMHYGCGAGVWNTFGFTIEAADSDGIASVTVHWDPAGAPADSLAMTDEDGYGTLWDGGFDAKSGWSNGPIKVWFQGQDNLGNLGPIFNSTDEGISFELAPCPSPT